MVARNGLRYGTARSDHEAASLGIAKIDLLIAAVNAITLMSTNPKTSRSS